MGEVEAATKAHETARDAERLAGDELGNCLQVLEGETDVLQAELHNRGEHGESDRVARMRSQVGDLRGLAATLEREAKRLHEELGAFVPVVVEHE